MRLVEYEQLFIEHWPDSNFEYFQNSGKARAALDAYRSVGKLANYSDEELMTDSLATTWKKP
jgi:hypothetical protein